MRSGQPRSAPASPAGLGALASGRRGITPRTLAWPTGFGGWLPGRSVSTVLTHSRGRPRGKRGANTATSLCRRAVGGRADPIRAAPVWHPQPEMAVQTAHPGRTKGLTPKTAVCAVLEVRATPPRRRQAARPLLPGCWPGRPTRAGLAGG
jgi:hypothetical protein